MNVFYRSILMWVGVFTLLNPSDAFSLSYHTSKYNRSLFAKQNFIAYVEEESMNESRPNNILGEIGLRCFLSDQGVRCFRSGRADLMEGEIYTTTTEARLQAELTALRALESRHDYLSILSSIDNLDDFVCAMAADEIKCVTSRNEIFSHRQDGFREMAVSSSVLCANSKERGVSCTRMTHEWVDGREVAPDGEWTQILANGDVGDLADVSQLDWLTFSNWYYFSVIKGHQVYAWRGKNEKAKPWGKPLPGLRLHTTRSYEYRGGFREHDHGGRYHELLVDCRLASQAIHCRHLGGDPKPNLNHPDLFAAPVLKEFNIYLDDLESVRNMQLAEGSDDARTLILNYKDGSYRLLALPTELFGGKRDYDGGDLALHERPSAFEKKGVLHHNSPGYYRDYHDCPLLTIDEQNAYGTCLDYALTTAYDVSLDGFKWMPDITTFSLALQMKHLTALNFLEESSDNFYDTKSEIISQAIALLKEDGKSENDHDLHFLFAALAPLYTSADSGATERLQEDFHYFLTTFKEQRGEETLRDIFTRTRHQKMRVYLMKWVADHLNKLKASDTGRRALKELNLLLGTQASYTDKDSARLHKHFTEYAGIYETYLANNRTREMTSILMQLALVE